MNSDEMTLAEYLQAHKLMLGPNHRVYKDLEQLKVTLRKVHAMLDAEVLARYKDGFPEPGEPAFYNADLMLLSRVAGQLVELGE